MSQTPAPSARTMPIHPLLRQPSAQEAPVADLGDLADLGETLALLLLRQLRKIGLLATVATDQTPRQTLSALVDEQNGTAVAALFSLPETGDTLVILFQHALVFAATEAILGGDGREKAHQPGRALSRIEMRIARILAEQTAQAFQDSLRPRLLLTPRFEKFEINFNFLDLGARSRPASSLPLKVEVLHQAATLTILLPPALLASLATPPDHATPRPVEEDPVWLSRLGAEIGKADVKLAARFEDHGLTLGHVAALTVGHVLTLRGAKNLVLECNDHPLFNGRLGQADGHYAIRIDEAIDVHSLSGITL